MFFNEIKSCKCPTGNIVNMGNTNDTLVTHLERMKNDPNYRSDSNQQKALLEKSFRAFDKDNNQFIEKKEINTLMKRITGGFKKISGEVISVEEILKFIDIADSDSDGRITYDEYVTLVQLFSQKLYT